MSEQGKGMVSASLYYQMIASGAHHLANNKRTVDNLNVFPVPDGDTGTNMSMTMASSFRFLEKLGNHASLSEMVQEVARGALMGARGNSGVILSQVLRGFSEAWKEHHTLGEQMDFHRYTFLYT